MARRSGVPEKLYCGTTERIAKVAPVAGLPAGDQPIYLTDVYPGYFAFYASSDMDRYGILEIDVASLDASRLQPCEWYLEQSMSRRARSSAERQRRLNNFRKRLDEYRAEWKKSLQAIGVCTYAGPIPKKAIRRVAIYDPQTNPLITSAIADTRISLAEHAERYEQNRALTRWLMGEDVSPADWLAGANEDGELDKDKLADALQNKWGLDIFYYGAVRLP
jgi:hypothetical protein